MASPILAAQAAKAGGQAAIQVATTISSIYLQHINRKLQRRALERQLQKTTEVTLRNAEASADMLAEVRQERIRQTLGLAKQKAEVVGVAKVQAAQRGISPEVALERIEFQAGEAGLSLELQADQATANILNQSEQALQTVKDSIFSMDMSIDPYDIIGPITQLGKATLNYTTARRSQGQNIYGQDINAGESFYRWVGGQGGN